MMIDSFKVWSRVAQSVLKLNTLYLLLAIGPGLYAQCNTDLSKLLPDGSVNNEDRFGSALAISDQYMVVAAENSDTLGIYFGGAAYVYEETRQAGLTSPCPYLLIRWLMISSGTN